MKERARKASSSELSRMLPIAEAGYLNGAMENPVMTGEHALLLLKNPHVNGSHIQKLVNECALGRVYEVRAAIVNHPAAPPALAMNLAGFLFWRDLVRVAENYRLYPPLRRRAEGLLSERLTEMTEGEMVALARIAERGLIKTLRKGGEPRVTAALLDNPRLVEEDVLAVCRAEGAAPETLAAVAHNDRWNTHRSVRMALARNPATPIADSLRCLQGLLARDLEILSQDVRVPTIVRVGAERRLMSRPPAPSRRPAASPS